MNIDECMKKIHPNYEELGVEEKKRADWDRHMMEQMSPDVLETIFSMPSFYTRAFNVEKVEMYWNMLIEEDKNKYYDKKDFYPNLDNIEENLIEIKELENEVDYTDNEKIRMAINIGKYWDKIFPSDLDSNSKEYHKRLMILNWSIMKMELSEAYYDNYFVSHGFDKRTVEERMKDEYRSVRTRVYGNVLYPNAELEEKRGSSSEEELDEFYNKIDKMENFIYENIEEIDNDLIRANAKLCGKLGKEEGKELIQTAIDNTSKKLGINVNDIQSQPVKLSDEIIGTLIRKELELYDLEKERKEKEAKVKAIENTQSPNQGE